MKKAPLQRSYKAGDILAACDNELLIPDGLVGHSAIALNDRYMLESVNEVPSLRISPISQFSSIRSKIAVYRPKKKEWGTKAAAFARWYKEQDNLLWVYRRQTVPFSLSTRIPLDSIWQSVYCSKLIWLCYHYGAGYTFSNDHFLFSPEDLDTQLYRNNHFKTLYRHPQFVFYIDS